MSDSNVLMWAMLGLGLLAIVAGWRIYAKAGQPGWSVIVPIYGTLVYLRMTGRPWWWLLLFCVPVVNVVPAIMGCFDLARVFNRGAAFGFGLLFLWPLFWTMLAFGGSTYVGPSPATAPAMRRAA